MTEPSNTGLMSVEEKGQLWGESEFNPERFADAIEAEARRRMKEEMKEACVVACLLIADAEVSEIERVIGAKRCAAAIRALP